MKPYERLEHTADMGVRVFAKDMPELFLHSAQAMFDIIADSPQNLPQKTKQFDIKLSADNLADLLHAWLSELLSLSDCEKVIFTDYQIFDAWETALTAKATGYPNKYFSLKREIKAVTYHELSAKKVNEGFEAVVIFDL